MKITRISVEFVLDEGTAVEDFMARLLSTAPAPVTIEHTPLQPATQIADANAAALAEAGSRRRRRTAAETATDASLTPVVTVTGGEIEPTSRRRRTPAPEAASPPPAAPAGISDVDLTKAASDTADVLVNMGEDGTGIVKLILADMQVSSVGDLPQDQRQKFLDECKKEIKMAKEEKEMTP